MSVEIALKFLKADASLQEKIKMLNEYKEALEREAQGVKERISELEKEKDKDE